jgi:hypothetical protein
MNNRIANHSRWVVFAPLTFLPSMALDQGFTPSLALYLLSIVKYVPAAPVPRIHLSAADLRTSATSIFGRIIPPYFADHFDSFNVVTICTGMSGVSILALLLPFCYHKSHTGVIIFALAYGFFSGAVVSLLMPCVAKAGSSRRWDGDLELSRLSSHSCINSKLHFILCSMLMFVATLLDFLQWARFWYVKAVTTIQDLRYSRALAALSAPSYSYGQRTSLGRRKVPGGSSLPFHAVAERLETDPSCGKRLIGVQ